MDNITIKDLSVYAYHGLSPEEGVLGQNFFISAELSLDLHAAGRGDNITKTVNYAAICHFINEYTRTHPVKLIEAAAEQLAEQILIEFAPLKKISLTIKKPSAPIGLPLQYVSVTITRSWHEAFVAFGSNLGDRKKYINTALDTLRQTEGIQLDSVSSFYSSTPYGGVEQDDFLNGAVLLHTLFTPLELLSLLQKIEQAAQRKHTVHWGPRTLDLDILFYDNEIIRTATLIVPHPDMINRDFVLKPMVELAPYKLHPLLQKSMQELYAALPPDQLHLYKEGKPL